MIDSSSDSSLESEAGYQNINRINSTALLELLNSQSNSIKLHEILAYQQKYSNFFEMLKACKYWRSIASDNASRSSSLQTIAHSPTPLPRKSSSFVDLEMKSYTAKQQKLHNNNYQKEIKLYDSIVEDDIESCFKLICAGADPKAYFFDDNANIIRAHEPIDLTSTVNSERDEKIPQKIILLYRNDLVTGQNMADLILSIELQAQKLFTLKNRGASSAEVDLSDSTASLSIEKQLNNLLLLGELVSTKFKENIKKDLGLELNDNNCCSMLNSWVNKYVLSCFSKNEGYNLIP